MCAVRDNWGTLGSLMLVVSTRFMRLVMFPTLKMSLPWDSSCSILMMSPDDASFRTPLTLSRSNPISESSAV